MLSPSVYSRSNLYLNQNVVQLRGDSASIFVHYWGAKPQHRGNRPHTHSFFEICYVVQGEGVYYSDGVTYPLRAGTLYCSKPESRHFIRSDEGMLLLFVALEPVASESSDAFLHDFQQVISYPHLFIPNAEHTAPAHIWQALLLQAADPESRYPETTRQLAYSFVMSCLSLLLQISLTGDTVASAAATELQGTLKRAKAYIQSHLTAKISLADVAQSLHVSERQLSRLMAEELGQSFPSVVKTERVKRAAYLLGFTDIPLKQIAEDTGFESIHYFTQVFTKEIGTPPSTFRKKCLNPESVDALIHKYLEQVATRYQKKQLETADEAPL
ncbi:helix-turn-helix domain-containing protein [Paenibacillus sp. GCM10023248]|uniref:AraC family transcriptional regulator n=1 Tax=unclassified Paenibacillus TaxID=185978 RepID=UPI002379334C|nr:AraC family transcriptional regulator [Paenibacillus sp. MAHUQ-63]MDD9268160.1 AraC family transcriptional regulator [Paenibacillus sp. MAHUQ-63]